MDSAEKVGIAITAAGALIDAFEVFFPGKLAGMSTGKRGAVFAVGTALVVAGLGVVLFSSDLPIPPVVKGPVITASGNGNCNVAGSGNHVNCAPAAQNLPPKTASAPSLSETQTKSHAKVAPSRITVTSSPGSIIAPSGGQNSITNNFVGAPQRALSDVDKAALLSTIAKDKPVRVMYLNNNTESKNYAEEIHDFLASNGYQMAFFGWHEFGDTPPGKINVNLHAQDDSEVWITIGSNQ